MGLPRNNLRLSTVGCIHRHGVRRALIPEPSRYLPQGTVVARLESCKCHSFLSPLLVNISESQLPILIEDSSPRATYVSRILLCDVYAICARLRILRWRSEEGGSSSPS